MCNNILYVVEFCGNDKKMNILYSNFVDCDKLMFIEIGEIISSVRIVLLW